MDLRPNSMLKVAEAPLRQERLVMPVDRDYWGHTRFTAHEQPGWSCPSCKGGNLALENETLHDRYTADTRRDRRDDDWQSLFARGRFTCIYLCQNPHCREAVTVAGEYEVLEGDHYAQFNAYTPRFVDPPLDIFVIPKQCPAEVSGEITAAFALFWCDHPGAMNHLRKSLELIMDHVKIPRFQMVQKKGSLKKRRRRRDLHNRIDYFRRKNSNLADRLEAVKWLGNEGSHGSDVSAEDLYDAFDLIEDFLHEYFGQRERKIAALSNKIIKKRKK